MDNNNLHDSGHYCLLASDFDYFYLERSDALIPALVEELELRSDHTVLDVGSGTGYIAEGLFRSSKLKNPVWCVEPSKEMHDEAQKRSGIYPLQTTAEKFFSTTNVRGHFDRVIAVECAHHFSDKLVVFRGIERSMRPGGVCIISCLNWQSEYPLFKSATECFKGSVSEEEDEVNIRLLQEAYFEVQVLDIRRYLTLTKSKWYEMLRGRFWSFLRLLTDEQVEEGILELERGKLKEMKFDETMKVCHVERFIKAKKALMIEKN